MIRIHDRAARTLLAAAAALFMAGGAQATLISADFRTESNLPDYRAGLPLVYEDLGATIDGGVELTGADFLENPDSWNGGLVHVDYDPNLNQIILLSQDTLDFQTFDVWISNIAFDRAQEIVGVQLLVDGISTTPVVVPTINFTGDSIHLSWDSRPDVFDFTRGEAAFQVTLSETDPIPEPATMTLLGLGLVGLAVRVRRNGNPS